MLVVYLIKYIVNTSCHRRIPSTDSIQKRGELLVSCCEEDSVRYTPTCGQTYPISDMDKDWIRGMIITKC